MEHVILVYFETSHGIYESTNNSDIFYLDGSTKQWPATWAAPQWNAPSNVKWWNAAPNDVKWWNVKWWNAPSNVKWWNAPGNVKWWNAASTNDAKWWNPAPTNNAKWWNAAPTNDANDAKWNATSTRVKNK